MNTTFEPSWASVMLTENPMPELPKGMNGACNNGLVSAQPNQAQFALETNPTRAADCRASGSELIVQLA